MRSIDQPAVPFVEQPAFSSIDCIGQCMMDRERSEAFERAIRETVCASDRVLDVGTGSGLLALLAARSGARQVTALEFDPYVAAVAARNAEHNRLAGSVDVIIGDAKSHIFPEERLFDVVIMELLTTGLVDESQVQAANNLHRQKIVGPNTRFIPCRQNTFAALGNMQFGLLGLKMKMVRHLWKDFYTTDELKLLTEKKLLHAIDFCQPCPEDCSSNLSFECTGSGVINCVVLTSITDLTHSVSVGSTLAMNAPVVIPIDDVHVEGGQTMTLNIGYRFGGGFSGLVVHLR